MTVENLPKNWSDQPLSDPSIAVDVVDLFISKADRRRGMFIVLLCDDRDRLLMPVAVDGLSGGVDELGGIVDVGPEDCEVMLKPFLLAAQAGTDSGILLAMGRFGPSDLPEIDEPWAGSGTTLSRSWSPSNWFLCRHHRRRPAGGGGCRGLTRPDCGSADTAWSELDADARPDPA